MPHTRDYLDNAHKTDYKPGSCFCTLHVYACMLNYFSCVQLCDPMDCSLPGSSFHGIPGKNTGVGCHALVQGICPIQGLYLPLLSLLHWQAGSLPLLPPGKPTLPVVGTKSIEGVELMLPLGGNSIVSGLGRARTG